MMIFGDLLCLSRSRDHGAIGQRLPLMAAGRLIFGLGAESLNCCCHHRAGQMVSRERTELRLRHQPHDLRAWARCGADNSPSWARFGVLPLALIRF